MKRLAIISTVFAIVILAALPGLADQGKGKSKGKKGAEQAVRDVAAEYTAAFNKGDAKALAALLTPQGDYVGPRGELIKGRKEIQKRFADFFAANREVKLQTTITAIRLIKDDVAIMDGITDVTPPMQGPPVEVRFNVVFVKRDGRWLIESTRDVFIHTPSNYEHLKQLEWMVGDWKDVAAESDGVTVSSTCDWTVNKNFIIRKFTAEVEGRPPMAGTQLIGWDPRESRICSWVFDSSGGFIEGVWRRDGKRWIVKASGVLQNGQEVSATHILTYVDDDTCTFQSKNRVIGGRRQPDIKAVTIKREQSETGRPDSPKKPARETILP